ncbi:hypothetical protein, partial [Pararhodospirillum oryzae]|uniref:hypothetical protein n=1 Tax=Pararhodospirillum oryzae TaxID=478448 RepID=UPI001C3F518B
MNGRTPLMAFKEGISHLDPKEKKHPSQRQHGERRLTRLARRHCQCEHPLCTHLNTSMRREN